jgi:hypothetical protein
MIAGRIDEGEIGALGAFYIGLMARRWDAFVG